MKIAISGAGVAGPALAYWLLRCGHEPTLIEAAPALRTGGYVIDFWGVGYQVAQRMGIEPALLEAGYQVGSIRSVDGRGRIRAELRTDRFQELAGGGFTSLPRGDLAASVYASLEGRVETCFGNSIRSIEQDDKRVRLDFEHGPSREFDLLVGADGLHSNVRNRVFGPENDYEHFLGYRVAAAVVDGYEPRDELVYVGFGMPGRQLSRFTLRGNRTLFLFVFRSADRQDPGDVASRRALLQREFGDGGWECRRILAALDEVEELYFDVVSQIRMPRWSKGRVMLIGDAAACVSLLAGEGTGLAMTEAYVLAGELKRAGGDHERAFADHEARLRPLIEAKQKSAEAFASSFAPRTAFGIWLRNQALRAMNFEPLARLLIGRSLRDNIELPDYGM
jgi:2-polyprenyl-6-methoxyphenol hydroxylase-like FAD-dependent oxidoreductase